MKGGKIMSKEFDITKIKNGNEYFKKNIVMDEENDIMHNIHENVKKSEFKDYEALRKYLIDNPVRSVVYDDRMEMRPSCVARLDCLVQAYDDDIGEGQKTIENFNWDVEQQIIIWRGGF